MGAALVGLVIGVCGGNSVHSEQVTLWAHHMPCDVMLTCTLVFLMDLLCVLLVGNTERCVSCVAG